MSADEPAGGRDIAQYERAYGEHAFEVVQAMFRKRMLLELLERLQPSSILEVGCGLDSLANHWAGAERFVVVEPGAGFAAEARRRTEGRRDVTVVEGALESTTAELSGDYDLILVSGLLHEVIDCGAVLDAVRTLCGTGTIVHANVPNANSFHRLLALEMGLVEALTDLSAMQKILQQHRTFTLDSLADLARTHGFSVFERGSYFVKPFTHGQMQELQAGGFMTPLMLEGLWGMAKHLPDMGSEIFVNLRPAS